MAKRSFDVPSFTATATADGATVLANGTFMGLASNATSGLQVSEIYIGGQATTSTVGVMQFARHMIVAVTPTTLVTPNSDGPLNSLATAAAAGGSVAFVGATTSPQRSTAITSARLNLSLNGFGGIVRWVAYPGEEWGIVGVSVNISESSLSCSNAGSSGSPLVGAHIIYESYAS